MITGLKHMKTVTLFIYLFYFIAAIAYAAHGNSLIKGLYIVSVVTLFSVNFLWQGLCFYSNSEKLNRNTEKKFIILIIIGFVTSLCMVYLSITNSKNHILFFAVGFLMVSAVIHASVLAAKQFSNYLSQGKPGTVSAWLPWVIAILYLPIGMFFIDKKMKSQPE